MGMGERGLTPLTKRDSSEDDISFAREGSDPFSPIPIRGYFHFFKIRTLAEKCRLDESESVRK
jgi:hypothetical protein